MTLTAPPPTLHLRHVGPDHVRLAATLMRPSESAPPDLLAGGETVRADSLVTEGDRTLWRYEFRLPQAVDSGYEIEGRTYTVNTDFSGDLRIAYVACNGQEHGDLDRPEEDRNTLWRHLGQRNEENPFQLILHGGDQIYADEVTEAHPLTRGWPEDFPDRLTADQSRDVEATLTRAFFERYATQYAQPGFAGVVCRVPSLAMWDDHDICDGWGSLPESTLDSNVGRLIFRCARAAFLPFQFGVRPDEQPGICIDRSGANLSWKLEAPGLTILTPDLRSTRRPERVMDEKTWEGFTAALENAHAGRVLLMSSVPALGPRLSLIERAMQLTRRMEHYEDDLRDQWQSRSHRAEWQRFLRALIDVHQRPDTAVTLLSGEIHLATRGTMDSPAGLLHQLVASGISHPPPHKAYARGLGTLARLGEAPLPGHRIRLRPLPGMSGIYVAQRNYLVIIREGGAWTARWHLEESGTTEPLML